MNLISFYHESRFAPVFLGILSSWRHFHALGFPILRDKMTMLFGITVGEIAFDCFGSLL